MGATRFSEDVRPITDLKVHSSELVEQVLREKRPLLLTRRGRGVAVLLDLSEYESLVDRGEFLAAVQQGAAAAAAGDLHPEEEALSILEAAGEDAADEVALDADQRSAGR